MASAPTNSILTATYGALQMLHDDDDDDASSPFPWAYRNKCPHYRGNYHGITAIPIPMSIFKLDATGGTPDKKHRSTQYYYHSKCLKWHHGWSISKRKTVKRVAGWYPGPVQDVSAWPQHIGTKPVRLATDDSLCMWHKWVLSPCTARRLFQILVLTYTYESV